MASGLCSATGEAHEPQVGLLTTTRQSLWATMEIQHNQIQISHFLKVLHPGKPHSCCNHVNYENENMLIMNENIENLNREIETVYLYTEISL